MNTLSKIGRRIPFVIVGSITLALGACLILFVDDILLKIAGWLYGTIGLLLIICNIILYIIVRNAERKGDK